MLAFFGATWVAWCQQDGNLPNLVWGAVVSFCMLLNYFSSWCFSFPNRE